MNKKILGSISLLISALIYGSFGVLTRYFSEFAPFTQSWVKALFTIVIISFIFIFGKSSWKKIRKEDIKWFVIWILPASFQPVLTYLAFTHLPVGMVYFLSYSTMIFGGIVSGKIFFAEKLTLNKILSIILLFVGLIFIYGSDFRLIGNIYILFALLSGLVLGFWNTLTKKVSGHYSAYQMIALDSGTSLILCFIVSIFFAEKIVPITNITPWIWIFTFSIFAITAGVFMINGFKKVEAQVGSLILPMEIVFGSFFGFLFLNEVLNTNVYLGGLFILIAAILSTLGSMKKTKRI